MSAEAATGGWRARVGVPLALELAGLAILLLVALAMRLGDLDGPRASFPDLFDEGIRLEQLLLMANGFRPFRDIYSAQGLLLLDLLFPFYLIFGQTLGAIRLGVGLLSLFGLLGAWWSARQVAGAVGGLAAVLLLVTSASYLEGSRLALAEVPSLAPCLWAVGCALRWQRGGGPRWLYAAAVLATVGVLIKPMALAVAAPVGLLMVSRPGVRPRHVAIALGLAVGITAVLVVVMGPTAVWEQIVQYRVGARQGGEWEFRRNFKDVVQQPFREQPGLYVLALIGMGLLLATGWRRGLALAAWPIVTALLLLLYYPLHPKHLVYLAPPLALVGGAGLGRAAWLAWSDGPVGRPARLVTVALAALLAAAPVGTWPGFAPASAREVETEDPDLNVFDREVAGSLGLLVGPHEFLLADHPYLAGLARRMVPPDLVDPSLGRSRAGALTGTDVMAAAQEFDVRLVLIWAERFRRLPEVPGWLDRGYVLSQAFGTRNVKNARGAKDRSIYLRRDMDLAAARERLEGGLTVRETVDFDGKLRVLGARMSTDSVEPGEQFTVTVGWLALSPMAVDYHVALELVDESGKDSDQQEHDLEGGARGTSEWQPGRWLFRTFAIQPSRESGTGEYRLKLKVIDPKGSRPLPPTLQAGAASFTVDRSGEVTVGTVRIR